MKKLIFFMLLLFTGTLIYSRPSQDKIMPVTTSSESALSLYNQAMKYLDDVKVDKAIETFKKALARDKDFFMADYQLAFYYLLNRDQDNYEKYADAAIRCRANLNQGEKVLKDVLVKLQDGKIDVTDYGKKLVQMYPNDPNSYNNLVYFQTLAGDSTNIVETLKKAIDIAPNPASFYNQLGYAYITLNQMDKAKEAFDRYIELDPKNPNAYDSKGDYYMFDKQYEKAYESYMKAYYMDPSFSHDKAQIAKKMYESTEGKELDIVTM